jgi:hypothetical protein
VLSDYLFTGVVAGAAMLGIGLLAHALPAHSDPVGDPRRGLMVTLAAFVESLGILALVLGLVPAFAETYGAGGVQAALLVLVPVAALGIPAALLARPSDREGVRESMILMLAFIGGLAAVAAMVALGAVSIADVEASGFDFITIIAMLVAAMSAIGIGVVGGRALSEMGGADLGRTMIDGPPARTRTIAVAAVLEGVAVIAWAVALLMVFTRA